MKNIFIIPGYGIPKNIFKDEPYKRYLGLVFNHIYQICLDKKEFKPLIIFCGGNTDIFKPYKRTEALEMKKLFLSLTRRNFVKEFTKNWQYQLENKSLSTTENLLEAQKIISKIKSIKDIYIFVEFTRKKKIKIFAKEIFKNNLNIIALDFDLSINRYREPEFIKRKEVMDIKFGLMMIKDKKFLIKHRKILTEKIFYFRKMGQKKHQEAVNIWWQEKLKELKNGQLAQR